MIAIPEGPGDWAKTGLVYAPWCELTLRLNRDGPNDSQKVIASLDCGGGGEWTAVLAAQWREPFPPDMRYSTIVDLILIYSQHGDELWRDASASGLFWDYYPDYIEYTFAAQFTGLVYAERMIATPTRGVFVQHFDELDAEGRWACEKDNVATSATFGPYSMSFAAGDALSMTEYSVGTSLAFGYDWTWGSGSGQFIDIKLDGYEVPCDDLNENNGNVIGSENNITAMNEDWEGNVYAPIRVLYQNLPPAILRWAEDYPTARILDALKRYQDETDYILASDIHDYDSGLIWRRTWGAYPSWASTFLEDRKVYFLVQPESVELGGVNEYESDSDLVVPLLHYPLDNRDPEEGYVNALSFSHDGSTEIEGSSYPNFRQSNWYFISGENAAIWNAATYTRFTVYAGGYANVSRELVTEYFNELDSSATPWNLVWDLGPGLPTEDHCCWITLGAWLAIVGKFTWEAPEDRQFHIRIKHLVPLEGLDHIIIDTHDGDSDVQRRADFQWAVREEVLDYYLRVSVSNKGVNMTHLIDLDAPHGWTSEPELYHVSAIQFLDLIPGDDIEYTQMKIVADRREVLGESARMQVSVPLSEDGSDKFGVALFIGGHQCAQKVDDGVSQEGVQRGIVHCYPLFSSFGDISQLRTVQELVDIGNLIPGWNFTKNDIGNALEDSDGNVLVPEAVMFLRQDFALGQYPAGDVPLFVQCRSITLPYESVYTARPYAIFGGAFNGLAWDSKHAVRASVGTEVQIVRCSGLVPTSTVEAVATVDEDGYWCGNPLYEDLRFAVQRGWDTACHRVVNREARWISAKIVAEIADVCFVEHIRNVVSIFYTEDGIRHIYTAPPDWYARYGINQANYTQPHQDTTEADSSPSGYSDKNGFVRLYFVRDGTVHRAVSRDWGGSWNIMATNISGTKCDIIGLPVGVQIAVVYDDGSLKCFRSHDHFATVDWQAVIDSGVDECQPAVYAAGMILYAATFVDGVLTVYRSLDLGRTWTHQ